MLGKWISKRHNFKIASVVQFELSKLHRHNLRNFSRMKSQGDPFLSKQERMKKVAEATLNSEAESNFHKIKYKTSQTPSNEYDNSTPLNSMKSMFRDSLFRNFAFWGLSFIMCMFISKKLMQKILIKKWNPDKDHEFLDTVPTINPQIQPYKLGFMKDSRFFVQVIRNKEESQEYKAVMEKLSKGAKISREEKIIVQEHMDDQKIHPHYFELKRVCRDIPVPDLCSPLSIAKLEIDKFDENNPDHQKIFKRFFKAVDIKTIKNSTCPYMIVDTYSNWLWLEKDNIDLQIASRFLKGPQQISNEDDLFQLMDAKRNLNMHYFIIYNGISQNKEKKFSPLTKIFRKFYIENGHFFEPQAEFIEIANLKTANKIGITEEGVLHHFANSNDYIKNEGTPIKFYSLDLIQNINETNRLKDITNEYYKEHFYELFNSLAQFVEKMICDSSNIIYTCDLNLLLFYSNHFSKKGETVLLVYVDRNRLLNQISTHIYGDRLKLFIKHLGIMRDNLLKDHNFKIIVCDSENCLSTFKILTSNNTDIVLRLYNYDSFCNMNDGIIVSRYDDEVDKKISNPKDFTFLKTGVEINSEWTSHPLHSVYHIHNFVERSFPIFEKAIENQKVDRKEIMLETNEKDIKYKNSTVKPMGYHNYDKLLNSSGRYSVIKVYSHICQGCKFIEEAFEELAKRYSNDKNFMFFEVNTSSEGIPIQNVRKTPTILLYDKKTKLYKVLELNAEDMSKLQTNDEKIEFINNLLQSSIK